MKNLEEKHSIIGLINKGLFLLPAAEDEEADVWDVRTKDDDYPLGRFNTEAAAIDYSDYLAGDPFSLLEAVADIAFFAGQKGYYSGDSRADMSYFIHLAKEFETRYSTTEWGLNLDYIETMEDYCDEMFDPEHFGTL